MYYANDYISITTAVVETRGVTLHKNDCSVCLGFNVTLSIWFRYSKGKKNIYIIFVLNSGLLNLFLKKKNYN